VPFMVASSPPILARERQFTPHSETVKRHDGVICEEQRCFTPGDPASTSD
jgi:hypothetical protein